MFFISVPLGRALGSAIMDAERRKTSALLSRVLPNTLLCSESGSKPGLFLRSLKERKEGIPDHILQKLNTGIPQPNFASKIVVGKLLTRSIRFTLLCNFWIQSENHAPLRLQKFSKCSSRILLIFRNFQENHKINCSFRADLCYNVIDSRSPLDQFLMSAVRSFRRNFK